MSQHTKNDLNEKQENIYQNLAVQFKRDFNNCNNGSFETRSRYWHALRHTYAQRSKARLLARGMSEQQARREVSERLGHHRSAITKIYEE